MSLTEGFKEALSCWCSGVSVVATRGEDGLMYGLTVSSFSSLSLDPPLILTCIDNRNRFPSMVQQSGAFAVSILAAGQDAASNHFASRGREPSLSFEIPSELTDAGQPVITGAAAWLDCELERAVDGGDHTIIIGRVIQTRAADLKPLIYFRRGYRTVTD